MNATRNTRKALSWRFVMGTSVARILDSLYPYLCPWGMYSGSDGGINAGTSVGWWNVGVALILVSWLGIQCLGLYLQQVYGARCFVPYWVSKT